MHLLYKEIPTITKNNLLMNWYKKAQLLEDFPTISFHEIVYHGTYTTSNNFFTDLDESYSEWGAVWVTDDERASEGFALDYGLAKNEMGMVLKIEAKLPQLILLEYGNPALKELQEQQMCEDIRECIPYLTQVGYDGWKTMGNLGPMLYNDIAVFGTGNDLLTPLAVKLYRNNEWSEYMSISDAEDLIESLIEKEENELV